MSSSALINAISAEDGQYLLTAEDRAKVRRVMLNVADAVDAAITIGGLHVPTQVFVRLALSLSEEHEPEPMLSLLIADQFCYYDK
jgi:hypothetical protein